MLPDIFSFFQTLCLLKKSRFEYFCPKKMFKLEGAFRLWENITPLSRAELDSDSSYAQTACSVRLWRRARSSMGAAQSDLGEFEDPGPPVTKERILRAVK